MTSAVRDLELVCESLRDGGVPIRTWCGLRVLGEDPRTLALEYGIEVERVGTVPASLHKWPVSSTEQAAGIAIAAKRSLRLINDEHGTVTK